MDPLRKYNQGFSLIELMIAMVISLLIVAGLFYSVMGDMRAYESVRSTQALTAKSRMAVQTMRLYIQQAGFRDIATLRNSSPFGVGLSSAGVNWISRQTIQGMTASTVLTDEKAGSDILVLRFLGSAQSGVISCNGSDVGNSTLHEITLYVNASNQLVCQDNANAALILDENVEFLELLYGTTDNNTRYFTAATMTDWNDIDRIKIGLLLSQNVSAHGLINSNAYKLFNQTVSAANDTNYRSVVMETVLIRNKGN